LLLARNQLLIFFVLKTFFCALQTTDKLAGWIEERGSVNEVKLRRRNSY
jgi:hypothetical protein